MSGERGRGASVVKFGMQRLAAPRFSASLKYSACSGQRLLSPSHATGRAPNLFKIKVSSSEGSSPNGRDTKGGRGAAPRARSTCGHGQQNPEAYNAAPGLESEFFRLDIR